MVVQEYLMTFLILSEHVDPTVLSVLIYELVFQSKTSSSTRTVNCWWISSSALSIFGIVLVSVAKKVEWSDLAQAVEDRDWRLGYGIGRDANLEIWCSILNIQYSMLDAQCKIEDEKLSRMSVWSLKCNCSIFRLVSKHKCVRMKIKLGYEQNSACSVQCPKLLKCKVSEPSF